MCLVVISVFFREMSISDPLPLFLNWVICLVTVLCFLTGIFFFLVFFHPLQVEEVKRRQYSLAFSSAGAQAQTYHVSFETLAEYQRWQRQASKVISHPTAWCRNNNVEAQLKSVLKLNLLPKEPVTILVHVTPSRSVWVSNEWNCGILPSR